MSAEDFAAALRDVGDVEAVPDAAALAVVVTGSASRRRGVGRRGRPRRRDRTRRRSPARPADPHPAAGRRRPPCGDEPGARPLLPAAGPLDADVGQADLPPAATERPRDDVLVAGRARDRRPRLDQQPRPGLRRAVGRGAGLSPGPHRGRSAKACRTRSRRRSRTGRRAARTGSRPRSGMRARASASRLPASRSRCRATSRRAPASAAAARPRSPASGSTSLLTSPLDPADLLALATDIEGHPDNAAAALLGGLTVSCQRDDGRVIARSLALAGRHPARRRHAGRAELETAHARRVLPATIPMRDAHLQPAARAAARARARVGRVTATSREALRDRWHQPARAPLVPGLTEALALEDPSVLGVCLSGAGPSIVMFTERPGRRGARASLERHLSACSAWRLRSECSPPINQLRADRDQLTASHPGRLMHFTLRCHLCQASYPAEALWVCNQCLGPLEVAYDYAAIAPLAVARADRGRAQEPVALSRAAADCRRAAHRAALRLHAARQGRPAGRAPRRPRALREGRLGQPSDLLLQGPRRLGRRDARRRARASRCSPARRPAISPAASPRTPRGSASPARSSSPTISSRARSPAPASTGRASSPCAATTTT